MDKQLSLYADSPSRQAQSLVLALYQDAERHEKLYTRVGGVLQGLLEELGEDAARHSHLLRQATVVIAELRADGGEQAAQLVQTVMTFVQQDREVLTANVAALAGYAEVAMPAAVATPAWMPTGAGPDGAAAMVAANVRRVGTLQSQPHDVVSRLRNSWPGQLYVRHLKRFILIRQLTFWLWRNGYPLYVNHLATRFASGKHKRWRPLVRLSDFARKAALPSHRLAEAAVVETPVPKVVPMRDQEYLLAPHLRYEFPELYAVTLKNGTVYGGSNLVMVEGRVVCHDLFDAARDYTSEELHGRIMIDPPGARIRWLARDATPEPVAMAATFFDACAPNYAHWLTEVLPRIAVYCADPRFEGVPIAVNDGLHRNIMESLHLVVGDTREIITLATGRALLVAELHLTSVAGYVPFERRDAKLDGHSHGKFSSRAVGLMRARILKCCGHDDGQAWPEKVYLRRNSGTRKVTNVAALEEMLRARGYVVVEPEKLTFAQQVRLFSNAKTIIGSSGAALANLLFVREDAKIYILISKYPDTSYWYWQNMACAAGGRINYIFGEIDGGSASGIHADFKVDLDNLLLEMGQDL